MNFRFLSMLLIFSFVAGCQGVIDGDDQDELFQNQEGEKSVTCGTPSLTPEETILAEEDLAKSKAQIQAASLDDWTPAGFWPTIPVYWHIIKKLDGQGNEMGGVTRARMDANIQRLNEAYDFGTFGFKFETRLVEEEIRPEWWLADYRNDAERASRSYFWHLRKSTRNTLHIYVNGLLELGHTGYNRLFPWDVKTATDNDENYLDGVGLANEAITGGTVVEQVQLGNYLVHETGHWLGLLHTFENGCNPPGDGVNDTPAHSVTYMVQCPDPIPDSDCLDDQGIPVGKVPIHNHMAWTTDACMNEFTPQQKIRAVLFYQYDRQWFEIYLPDVVNDYNCSKYDGSWASCGPGTNYNCKYTWCGKCVKNDVDPNDVCCQPQCSGKQCGSDGCGGSCGTCSGQYRECNTSSGQCQCQAGHEFCNNTCCATGQQCINNSYCGTVCTPNCSGKTCGPDGCGGTCGACNGANQQCSASGQCSCIYSACYAGSSLTCCGAGQICSIGGCATPSCTCSGKVCGPDSCGNGGEHMCGDCSVNAQCSSGQCQHCGGFTSASTCVGHCAWYSYFGNSFCLHVGTDPVAVNTCLDRTPPNCGTGCSNYTCVDKCLPTGTDNWEVCGY